MNHFLAKTYTLLFSLFIFSISFSQLDNSEQILQDLQNLAHSHELSSEDIFGFEISNQHVSRISEIQHIYLKQYYNGLPVDNANIGIHKSKAGEIVAFHNQFVRQLKSKINTTTPRITALDALKSCATYMGKTLSETSQPNISQNTTHKIVVNAPVLSNRNIPIELKYLSINNEVKLVWNLNIEDNTSTDWINYYVDATTGSIIAQNNWTNSCNIGEDHSNKEVNNNDANHVLPSTLSQAMPATNTYNVLPYPIESPHEGSRAIVVHPELNNTNASPDGWHKVKNTSYTHTRGNNTDTYLDKDNSNKPTNGNSDRASGGSNLNFSNSYSPGVSPARYQKAAVTNLFYWTNLNHDIWYNYGFDEVSGNFQEYNFARGGNENDGVLAEAQDQDKICNATFATPADGLSPRMQMHVCWNRDVSFDNGVICHEYGHGISNRLTGGANNANALTNAEQMGEGWSDWVALMLTMKASDKGTDARPVGHWYKGHTQNGPGIRTHPYSTDLKVSPYRYLYLKNANSNHDVGEVWAAMLWDMTWGLIDKYGYDSDIYNGTGGNNKAMILVIEALKLQPTNPGFVDGRDAILLADRLINGGANQCIIWEAFARRGLGIDAKQNSTYNRKDGVESFKKPSSCDLTFTKTADVVETDQSGTITYTLKATNHSKVKMRDVVISDPIPNNTSYVSSSASNGGYVNSGEVFFPKVDLNPGVSITRTFKVNVKSNAPISDLAFHDGMENGHHNWSTEGIGNVSNWEVNSLNTLTGSKSWAIKDVERAITRKLTLDIPIKVKTGYTLQFSHYYDINDNGDFGQIYISDDNGATWYKSTTDFIQNGYPTNQTTNYSLDGFTGSSNSYITSIVDLSRYTGKEIIVQFRFKTWWSGLHDGWYIDNVAIGNISEIPNTANLIASGGQPYTAKLLPATIINDNLSKLKVNITDKGSPDCYGANNGFIEVKGAGGTGNYSYLWNTGETTAKIQNITGGNHSVVVSDGNNSASLKVRLPQPSKIRGDIYMDPATSGNNGAAEIDVYGGVEPYEILWSNGIEDFIIENVAAGKYNMLIEDASGCLLDTFVIVTSVTPPLTASLSNVLDVSCYNAKDGSATINPAGGFGSYTYQWSNGAQTKFAFNLSPGNHSVTVYSGNKSITKSFVISEPTELDLTTTSTDVVIADDGTANSVATGGTPNYTYEWSNGAKTPSITGLSAGTYQLEVTDAIGCKANSSVQIDKPISSTNTCKENTIYLDIQFDNYPAENEYIIRDASGNIVEESGKLGSQTSGSLFKDTFCLPNGCYSFEFKDSYGDGICCSYGNGQFSLFDENGKVLSTGSNFGAQQLDNFCLGNQSAPSYCDIDENYSQDEWIESVTIGSFTNKSGNNNGYGDFTSKVIDLDISNATNIVLEPGFRNGSFQESWVIWVDYNRDGDYDDFEEKTFSLKRKSTITSYFTLPANAKTGLTGMRIAMRYNLPPPYCGIIDNGEVEDYVVNIEKSGIKDNTNVTGVTEIEKESMFLSVYPNPTSTGEVTLAYDISNHENSNLTVMDLYGRIVYEKSSFEISNPTGMNLDLSQLSNATYIISIRTSKGIASRRIIKNQ